jgi:RNA polymerase sigma-70 factor (ECF subfamily)
LQSKELVQAISSFLRILPVRHRVIFLSRYFYMEDLAVIAKANGMREANVRMLLSRIRQKLRKHLIQEGYL